jgi:hypothetical protein
MKAGEVERIGMKECWVEVFKVINQWGNVKPERVTKPQKQNRGVEERIRGRTAWHSRYRLLASDALDSF